MSTLHEYVSKDILPAELGGEGPSFNPSVWSDQLLEESLKTAEDPLNETISDASGNNSDSSSSESDENTNSYAQAQVRYVLRTWHAILKLFSSLSQAMDDMISNVQNSCIVGNQRQFLMTSVRNK